MLLPSLKLLNSRSVEEEASSSEIFRRDNLISDILRHRVRTDQPEYIIRMAK